MGAGSFSTATYGEAPRISLALYVTVAVIWFLPDRRIEKLIKE